MKNLMKSILALSVVVSLTTQNLQAMNPDEIALFTSSFQQSGTVRAAEGKAEELINFVTDAKTNHYGQVNYIPFAGNLMSNCGTVHFFPEATVAQFKDFRQHVKNFADANHVQLSDVELNRIAIDVLLDEIDAKIPDGCSMKRLNAEIKLNTILRQVDGTTDYGYYVSVIRS